MRHTRSHSAFSLVELLVVLGIIAILLSAILNIPWSNLTRYARTSALDQIESAAASARVIALERGRNAAAVFTQSDQSDVAYVSVVVESDTSGVFYYVDGIAPAALPRGTTVRAPASGDGNNTAIYQTFSSNPNPFSASTSVDLNTNANPDNVVNDGNGNKNVKCFAVGFDSQGRLLNSGGIHWVCGTKDTTKTPSGSTLVALNANDLLNVPFAPYAVVMDTRTLTDANALCFTNGQSAESFYLLNTPSTIDQRSRKMVTFNRYSGNVLRP